MPGRVDAEAVDAVVVDPAAIDVDEALHHARVFGEQVVEAGEVAVHAGFAVPGAVAPVVIEADVVEPGRGLHRLLAGGDVGRVRIVGVKPAASSAGIWPVYQLVPGTASGNARCAGTLTIAIRGGSH